MSTPKPKVATKKKLLESIEHLQMTLTQARKDEERERGARYVAQEALKKAESKLQDSEYRLSQAREQNRIGEITEATAQARANALELALRLMHKAEKANDARMVAPDFIDERGKKFYGMGDMYDTSQTSHFPR